MSKKAKLIIPKEHIDFIGKHGVEEYPHEACGIILGHVEKKGETLVFKSKELRRAKNLSDNPIRFYLDPLDFMKIQEEADSLGIEIIGIYHTHPDHPPIASQHDLDAAVEDLFYIILSVRDGKPADFKGWFLNIEKGKKVFVESEVEVI